MTDQPKPPETPGMAEVSPKFVDEAEAATAAPPSSVSVPDHPDEDLLELCNLYRRRWDEIMELNQQADIAIQVRGDAGPEKREAQRLLADNENTRATILSTPAHTVAGVIAKIRHHYADAEIAAFGKDTDPDELPGDVVASVYGDLERLADAIDDPVLALKREWEARYKLLDEHRDNPDADDSDEAVDPLYNRLRETEYQILQTRATTPAGIAVKLVLWARLHCDADQTSGLSWNHEPIAGKPFDLDHLPVVSALNDLEHMAGA